MRDKDNPSYCSKHGCCPFANTTESMIAQGHGCLPTEFDIVEMRVNHGRTWACHSDETKPCKGALNNMRERGIDCIVIDTVLLTLDDDWSKFVTYQG